MGSSGCQNPRSGLKEELATEDTQNWHADHKESLGFTFFFLLGVIMVLF